MLLAMVLNCGSEGQKPFQDKWEQNPVTDFNLFDLYGIGLIHQLEWYLYARHRQHRTIYYCTSCLWYCLAQLMAEGYASNQGVRTLGCLKAPAYWAKTPCSLNWTKEDNPKESDVVFELRVGLPQDVHRPLFTLTLDKPTFGWVTTPKHTELPPGF